MIKNKMKRSLLSLLAALALSTVVNAESYWIIIGFGSGGKDSPAALEKIHMWSILDLKIMARNG